MTHGDRTQNLHAGFHGPRCWIASAFAGLLLGILASFAISTSSTGGGGHHAADLPRVREIVPAPAGSALAPVAYERLPSGEVIPWLDTPRPLAEVPPVVETSPHAAPPASNAVAHHAPNIPLWLCAPFGLLLASIALMPFINAAFWARHFPDFAFFLGALITGFYLLEFGSFGRHAMLHAAIEYYSFIALVGGLFVVSGGILIDVRTRATPWANVALLAFGAVLANFVGTTGASMLLIRPFMRMNEGRLRPIHVVLFIFIVSNCGGCLTPIGDPPLYLGYLKGVPFMWTLTHLWPMWLVCVSLLLAIFFFIDWRIGPRKSELPLATGANKDDISLVDDRQQVLRYGPVSIQGLSAIGYLVLMVVGVFIDPLLKKLAGIEGYPIGATFQIIVAVTAYITANKDILNSNAFDFHPVQEVGFLFVGIFLTMVPALGYLATNAASLGLESPTQYYYFTGALSAVLDNAPTYLNFMQSALGVLHLPLDSDGIHRFIANTYDVIHSDGSAVHFEGKILLEAISLAAVFFGAMTYIGNGPNFMVKSISEASGVEMPSFFAYLGYACLILLPILLVIWAIFIR